MMYKIEKMKNEYLALYQRSFYKEKSLSLTKKENRFLVELEVVIDGIIEGKGGENV